MFEFANLISGLYVHTATETKLIVDTSRGEHLRINVILPAKWKLVIFM